MALRTKLYEVGYYVLRILPLCVCSPRNHDNWTISHLLPAECHNWPGS